MSERITKVNDLLRDLVSQAFVSELTLKPGVLLTISKVVTSKDLRQAKILVSVFPDTEDQYVKTALQNERGAIEQKVHSQLYMKPLPRLHFTIDTTERGADEVEKIILRKDF